MVICKYFLRGACRFGENCKNEHSYNENSGSVLRKKQDIDPSIIIKSVSNDMDKAEHGNQWPFTCYGPFQGKPCFPGFEDKSFEEIRLGLYEAEKNGTGEQYKQQLPQFINEIRMKMRSLQNPTPDATNLLKELFNSNLTENQNTNVFTNNTTNQPSIFGNTAVSQNVFATQAPTSTANAFSFTSPQNNLFRGSTNNPVATGGSLFSQNNQAAFSSNNIFGGGSGTSIFANAQQNFATNTNVFQSTPSGNQNFVSSGNIFNNQPNNQLFAQQSSGGSIFTQNIPFAQKTIVEPPNPFKQNTTEPPNPFKQNTTEPPNPFKQNTTEPPNPFKQNTVESPNSFKQNTAEAPNLFKQNNTESPNPFKQNTAEPSNLFKQPKPESFPQNTNDPYKQNTMNIYHQNQPLVSQQVPFSNNSPFTQNSVLHAQNQATTNNLTAHTKSIFGSMQSNQSIPSQADKRQDDVAIYSKLEDLTENEIKCYEAATFEFGKIPVNPPTLQMC